MDAPRILNSVLGSGARVRVVRFLTAESNRASSVSEIARGTGLTKQGVSKALRQLVGEGVVIRSGSGRSNVYAFQSDSPLLAPLRELFSVESTLQADLVSDLRHALAGIPSLRAAWVRRWPDAANEAIEIEALADASLLAEVRIESRAALLPVEARHDRVVEVVVHTPADVPDLDSLAVTMLAGAPQDSVARLRTRVVRGEERAQRTMRTIALMLPEDPSLRKRGCKHLERLLKEDQGAASHDLLEWRQILEAYSDQRLADFLGSGSSRSMRLYQSMPFLAVLTPTERDRLLDAIEDQQ